MSNKRWGMPGSIKLSQDRKGYAIAVYNNGGRDYISQGEYVINWFGNPMKMEASQFNELFEKVKRGTAKSSNKNT